jgi:hypothetical protein
VEGLTLDEERNKTDKDKKRKGRGRIKKQK